MKKLQAISLAIIVWIPMVIVLTKIMETNPPWIMYPIMAMVTGIIGVYTILVCDGMMEENND